MVDDEILDRYDPFRYRDTYTWAMRQAEALRKRDLDAIDWKNVSKRIGEVGAGEWSDCLNWCIRLIEQLLLIEYYPAERESIRLWRDEALHWRWHLFHDGERNKGIITTQRDELLTEAWTIGRAEAIGSILELQDEDHSNTPGSINKEITDRWDNQFPKNCPYEWDEIASITPMQRHFESMEERWPRVVAQRLNATLGTTYPVATAAARP